MSELYRDFIDRKTNDIINILDGVITPTATAELYRDFINIKANDVITALNGTITPPPAGVELYRDFLNRKFNDVIAGIGSYIPPVSFPTVSGSIVTFNSQYAGLPLKSHKIALTATQSGSGTPSPDNVRTINGYSVLNIGHGGKNILDTSTLVNNPDWTYVDIHVKPNTVYTMSSNLPTQEFNNIIMFFKTQNGQNQYVYSGHPVTVTSSSSGIVQLQYRNKGSDDIQSHEWQIELGNTETAFTPYVDYDITTITIGSTVYGGEYDARTGILEVTSPTEQTIQLPPCPIDTLEGVNNIWADTGNTTLQYIKIGGNT